MLYGRSILYESSINVAWLGICNLYHSESFGSTLACTTNATSDTWEVPVDDELPGEEQYVLIHISTIS